MQEESLAKHHRWTINWSGVERGSDYCKYSKLSGCPSSEWHMGIDNVFDNLFLVCDCLQFFALVELEKETMISTHSSYSTTNILLCIEAEGSFIQSIFTTQVTLFVFPVFLS
jgi:hypothetical protein